jgi:DMSO/TMAO reductase YedYZ molybdopterin-dependent catalytic subunit
LSFVSRGFRGRRRTEAPEGRVPPGQYVTEDFPVLSAGPTPRIPLDEWSLSVGGLVDHPRSWNWEQFRSLPDEEVTVDIHCVTKWSKLDTRWQGVSLDTLLTDRMPEAAFALIHSYGGYTTNLPIDDLLGGKAWVVYGFDGQPLAQEHGGPARLLVPHLYFWKSAKWVTAIELSGTDRRGFWESYGYHEYGDPWREQRYAGD